jgi:hypothetical protein
MNRRQKPGAGKREKGPSSRESREAPAGKIHKIRRPNSEARKKSECRNPNRRGDARFGDRTSAFGFGSDFDLRFSDLALEVSLELSPLSFALPPRVLSYRILNSSQEQPSNQQLIL